MSAEAVRKAFFKAWITRVHSDRGAQFLAEVFNVMATFLGITTSATTPYHPQGIGAIQRFHRTLNDMLRCLSEPNRWIEN